jgi:hypothetical protein
MTAPVRESADPVTAPVAMCDVCGHPATAHDPIALRYCEATMTSALSRKCICR